MLLPHAFAANTLRWSEQIRGNGVVREAYGRASMSLVHDGTLPLLRCQH